MQLTVDLGYEQIFELARQLPPKEQERLRRELADRKESDGERIDEESKRRELIRLALEFPVATEDEIVEMEESIKEFRKEFNDAIERRYARLFDSD